MSSEDMRLRIHLRGWLNQLFEDAELLAEEQALRFPRVLALLAVVEPGQVSWFSAPLGWSEHQSLSVAGLFPFDPVVLLTDPERYAGLQVTAHHLVLGSQARLRCFGYPLEPGIALAGRTASGKTVTAVVPRQGEGVILKHSQLVANLEREAEALADLPQELLAPRHLGSFTPQEGHLITLQSLLPGQPLQGGGPMTEEQESAVVQSLRCLVRSDRHTSMLEQAGSLRSEVEAAPLPETQRLVLQGLLDGVRDSRPLPASRLHGDLRPLNLQVCPLERQGDQWRCGLGLLDWEFSRPCGLGVTDYLRLRLDPGYRDASSFAALLHPFQLRQLKSALSRLDLPGVDSPIDGLLRLHVVTHALDRLVSFANSTTRRMVNLRSMLASPWPL